MTSKKQITAFLLVGAINTFFGYSCYACFIFLGMSYPIALLCATILSVLFNFKTMGTLVFKNSNNLLFFKFIAAYLCIYLFNISLVSFLKITHINLYIAGLIAIPPSALLSFILNKGWVFRSPVKLPPSQLEL